MSAVLGGRTWGWPDAVPGLGVRTIGAYQACRDCPPDETILVRIGKDSTGAGVLAEIPRPRGVWARYGAVALCRRCAWALVPAEVLEPVA